ncbi:hypothetical protein Y032_0015g2667 [Ancylostoma ceylanicum]|uniref:Uncharacterized protein n=1 Tax=Ancylostoma ceylanicum TaxID=53326 RepID=A0A016V7R5_9BILA|nr:hypothetical protein Y032_0015g2667 [Ancylostoma ceylanicum]
MHLLDPGLVVTLELYAGNPSSLVKVHWTTLSKLKIDIYTNSTFDRARLRSWSLPMVLHATDVFRVSSYPVSPDFATTAGHLHMDKVKEETPDERGDELRLAAIHGDVTWQSIPIISTVLISYIAGSF